MATVTRQVWDGSEIYTLENRSFSISVIPEVGSNVFRMRDKIAERDVLRAPDGLEQLKAKPVHYGIPLLLPPCRTRRGTFQYEGREYRLEINTPDGHHSHGFLRGRPWRVKDASAANGRAALVTEFDTNDFPELLSQYPHRLQIEAETALDGDSLVQTFTIRNLSETNAPIGFGLHTWFMLDATPDAWTLRLPVEDIWELDAELMPNGNRLPLDRYASLINGMNLQGQDMDMVFRIGNRPAEAVLERPGYSIRYTAEGPFTQWVVYTRGPVSDTICLEPLTWTPDAPNVKADPALTGLRAIEPGGEWKLRVRMDIERR